MHKMAHMWECIIKSKLPVHCIVTGPSFFPTMSLSSNSSDQKTDHPPAKSAKSEFLPLFPSFPYTF